MTKFMHHKYTWARPFTYVRHNWEFVGPDGGLNFHVSWNADKGGFDASAGLEFHHLKGEGAPHHTNCPLTGGRCWHNGTSLYASEWVWPMVKDYLNDGDHLQIFAFLEREYEKHFEADQSNSASIV